MQNVTYNVVRARDDHTCSWCAFVGEDGCGGTQLGLGTQEGSKEDRRWVLSVVVCTLVTRKFTKKKVWRGGARMVSRHKPGHTGHVLRHTRVK